MEDFVVMNPVADNIFRMIEAVIMLGFALSIVSNTLFKSIVKLDPVSVPTLLKNMQKLYRGVRDRIKEQLPDHFGIESDASKLSPTLNAVAVFAVFMDGKSKAAKKVLLGFNSLLDNTSSTSESYLETFDAILESFGKSRRNVVFFVGDNCRVNLKNARLWGIPLFSCQSHLWNLAMKAYSEDHGDLIKAIHEIMTFLMSSPKVLNSLKMYTSHMPVRFNDQRWWSLPAMLRIFKKLLPVLDEHAYKIGGAALVNKMLTPAQKIQFEEEQPAYKYLNQVTERLQKPEITRGEVHIIFKAVLDKYPGRECFSRYLSLYGDGVPSPASAAAVAKVLCGLEAEISAAELEALNDLECLTPEEKEEKKKQRKPDDDYNEEDDFVTAALKRHKKQQQEDNYRTKYAGLACIPATSNDCERLFSQVKWGFNERRKRMRPDILEMLTILRYHRDLWNIEMILPKDKNASDAQIKSALEEDIFIVD